MSHRTNAGIALAYPLKSAMGRCAAHFHSILKAHKLEWVWQFVIENNAGRKNTYHNNDHMMQVTRLAWELYHVNPECQNLSQHSLEVLLVACMLHDFNHSGGELTDEENVTLAIETSVEAIAGSLDNQFGTWFANRVAATIRVTQYPFVYQPVNVLQRIMRDADALQSFEPNGVTLIMEGLRMEMLGTMGRIPSYKEMYEGQGKFIRGLELFTEAGEDIRTALIDKMLESCAAYAALQSGEEQ